jgi:hypothetical protein
VRAARTAMGDALWEPVLNAPLVRWRELYAWQLYSGMVDHFTTPVFTSEAFMGNEPKRLILEQFDGTNWVPVQYGLYEDPIRSVGPGGYRSARRSADPVN